ncbi:hypothetical protein DL93DRAFT_2171711 [Clavulina sp. PMI_390]|nr:hypothetical protein DL93DRAFT_2171711 [Clavulina sp. PMI_390]
MDLEIEEIQLASPQSSAPVINSSNFATRFEYETGSCSTTDRVSAPTPEAVVANIGPHAEVLETVPPYRPMTWSEFAEWALSPSVRNGLISSVTWWTATDVRKRESNFIILRIPCRLASSSEPFLTFYDVRIEPRRKRVAGWHTLDISIEPSLPLEDLARDGKLVIGLLDSSENNNHDEGLTEVPDGLHSCPGFRDILDEKWRGPPPTLGHIVRYVQHIQELGPPFFWSPTHPSRRGFCRLLVHAIALRHYSFAQVVAPSPTVLEPRGVIHDPSSISCVMQLLILQEQWQPQTYSKTMGMRLLFAKFLGFLFCVAGITFNAVIGRKGKLVYETWRGLGFSLMYLSLPLMYTRYSHWTRQLRLSSRTRRFLDALDSDESLTLALGRRGAYIPSQDYFQYPEADTFLMFGSGSWSLELPGPRVPVPPWRHLEQNCEFLPKVFTGNPVSLSPASDSTRTIGSATSSTENSRVQPPAPTFHAPQGARAPLLPVWNDVSIISYHPDGRKRLFWLSKAVPANLNVTFQPDGFALGMMSNVDFCSWVMASPANIRNAVVRDVTWWRSNARPFHHQFVILTVDCLSPDGSETSTYDIKAERHGKGRNIGLRAEHRLTISYAKPFGEYERESCLILGLLGARQAHEGELAPRSLPPSFHTCNAFRDALDEKWRGPPPTLGHVARYIHSIIQIAPRYNLTSTNCYFFSRLLVHSIALRHHSFSLVAANSSTILSPLSVTHDPSAIGPVFRLLTREERESNGILFYRILVNATITGVALSIIGTFLWVLVRIGSTAPIYVAILASIVAVHLAFKLVEAIAWWISSVPLQSQAHRFAARTEKLVEMLDNDPTLTHPNGKRGQYPVIQQYIKEVPEWSWELPGPRAPIPPWEHPEQEFANLPTFYNGYPVESPMTDWGSV